MKTVEGGVPYVGVSGVVSPAIQAELEATARNAGLFDAGRALAIGVKAVHKTQFLDIENKYGSDWFPVGQEGFANALTDSSSATNTIAVAQVYMDADYVADAAYRRIFINRIVRRGPWLQAVQFDLLPWHINRTMLRFLEATKERYGLGIFLQCHKEAMAELGPAGVVRRLGSSAAFVDCLLFDASHGTGERLDTTALDKFLEEAHAGLNSGRIGFAVAGDLNAQNVRDDLPVLLDKYPNLSWDAEGQLHPVNTEGRRPLDMAVAADYLQASVEVLRAA